MTVKVNGKTYRVRFQRTTTATLSEVTKTGLKTVAEAQTKCHLLDEQKCRGFNQQAGEREALKRLLEAMPATKASKRSFWMEFLYRWGIKERPKVVTPQKQAKIEAYKARVAKQKKAKAAYLARVSARD